MKNKNSGCWEFSRKDIEEGPRILLPDGIEIIIKRDLDNQDQYIVTVIQENGLVAIGGDCPYASWDKDAISANYTNLEKLNIERLKELLPPSTVLVFNKDKSRVVGIGFNSALIEREVKCLPTH